MQSISDIFAEHDGKCSDKWENYLEVYEKELLPFRCSDRPVSLLEIGVQDGGSLEIWQKAMPAKSSIVGIDIDPRVGLLTYQPGVDVFVADASDPTMLRKVLGERKFDIVIDDASHKSSDIIITFETMFSSLNSGGLYIIEDLACSYQASFGGGPRRPGAAIEWLKCLVDILHVESWDGVTLNDQDLHLRDNYAQHIQRVTFYESIAVVAKRPIAKKMPTRRVFTGSTASHSTHIQMVARDFPIVPDQFRLTEAFARQVILENARQRDSRFISSPAPVSDVQTEPAFAAVVTPSGDSATTADILLLQNKDDLQSARMNEDDEKCATDSSTMFDRMKRHVEAQSDLFRPSLFWNHFNEKNIAQLEIHKLSNFKRTINQNYFNWIPLTQDDNQFKAVARLCAEDGPIPQVTIEDYVSLEGFFERNPLLLEEGRNLYAKFLGMLWQYTRTSSQNGLADVLEEPTLGNPLRCFLHGRLISQDLANSIRERNTILAPIEADLALGRAVSIVELGAGYGRLGYVLLSSARCRYTIVDIPPALYVSQWYLTTLFPTKKAFQFTPWTDVSSVLAELTEADICFLTPDQFAKLPNSFFDVAIAISNLAEMTKEQSRMYIELLQQKSKHLIYIKQWKIQRNDLDGVNFVKKDFDLMAPWVKLMDRDDAVQDLFFETVWRRS